MLGPGTVLGDRFELTRQLGDGSLGPVWLAQDRVLEETVVLKLLSPHLRARPELLALLKQECRLARRLRHPGIVRVHDFHSGRNHACISMEYVPGQSLSAWRGRPWPELQPLLVNLADALTHAHEMGVVHRDLKPENVQVDPSGRPHLMDFGVAGALEAGAESGAFPGGSPAGMSPQQLAGDPPHPADDVYGFGALIYELVCARPPLALPLDAERIRSEIPQPMHASPPPPAALVDLVSRMLAKGVAERPQNMVRVRAALDALSDTSDNRTLLPDIATATPPAVVAVPVSNGSTLAGIYKGFVSLYRRGKTSRIPRLVAGSSQGKNPIVSALIKNASRCDDLAPERIRETRVNEPLVNWHSIDGDYALEAIKETGGWAANASDKAMSYFSKVLSNLQGFNVLPASTAGLIALLERQKKEPLPGDRYVVILTGRKS